MFSPPDHIIWFFSHYLTESVCTWQSSLITSKLRMTNVFLVLGSTRSCSYPDCSRTFFLCLQQHPSNPFHSPFRFRSFSCCVLILLPIPLIVLLPCGLKQNKQRPGVYSLSLVVTTKEPPNCQMSPRDPKHPELRSTAPGWWSHLLTPS